MSLRALLVIYKILHRKNKIFFNALGITANRLLRVTSLGSPVSETQQIPVNKRTKLPSVNVLVEKSSAGAC